MKILASDMDGTLFFHRYVRRKDLSAIRKFQKAGNKFGLCTGRLLLGAVGQNPKGLHPDFYIASSGAIILDDKQNVLFSKTIPFEVGKNLWDTYSPKYWMMVQTASREKVFLATKSWREFRDVVLVDSYDVVKDETVHGISIVFKTVEEAKIVAKEIEEKYSEVSPFVNRNSIDIVPKGCSKGIATKFIQEHFGCEMVSGIGDSYNDLPMLEAADISFTFHKSPEDIKDKVTYIVNSVSEAVKILMKEK